MVNLMQKVNNASALSWEVMTDKSYSWDELIIIVKLILTNSPILFIFIKRLTLQILKSDFYF